MQPRQRNFLLGERVRIAWPRSPHHGKLGLITGIMCEGQAGHERYLVWLDHTDDPARVSHFSGGELEPTAAHSTSAGAELHTVSELWQAIAEAGLVLEQDQADHTWRYRWRAEHEWSGPYTSRLEAMQAGIRNVREALALT